MLVGSARAKSRKEDNEGRRPLEYLGEREGQTSMTEMRKSCGRTSQSLPIKGK